MNPHRLRLCSLGVAATLAIGALSVAAQDAQAPEAFALKDLAWLAGVWRTEGGAGPVFEEHWMSPAAGTMCGMGRMVIGERLVFHEYIRLTQEADGAIVYHALPNGSGTPTPFRLTSLEGTSVVFENPEHDDPKVIRYTLEGDRLTAVTEGERNGKPTRNVFPMVRIRGAAD